MKGCMDLSHFYSWYAEDTMRIPILRTLAKYNQVMSTCLVRALSLSAPPNAPLIGLLRFL